MNDGGVLIGQVVEPFKQIVSYLDEGEAEELGSSTRSTHLEHIKILAQRLDYTLQSLKGGVNAKGSGSQG